MSDRLLIVGWDGADWAIIDDLMQEGILPNVAAMLENGSRGVLRSTVPSHSWAAWPSFLTGVHPSRHSIYDFIERNPARPARRVPASSRSVKALTFLRRLSDAGHEVRAGNIPVTFPPEPVRGRMIAGVAIPNGSEFVYPPAWRAVLDARAPFPVNGMGWQMRKDRPHELVDEAIRLVEARTASFEALLEGEWVVAVCVYVEPDRVQHPFGAHLLPSHPNHEELRETEIAHGLRRMFRALDEALERLVSASGDATTVVLMSDHGFRPITRVASMNAVLERLGFTARRPGVKAVSFLKRSKLARRLRSTRVGPAVRRAIRPISGVDWSRSRAYETIPGGGVTLAIEGRDADGTVPAADAESVREELRQALLAYHDPETGERIVGSVLTRDDMPRGPYEDLGPDLIAVPAPYWTFGFTDELSTTTDWPTGTHRADGVIVTDGSARRSNDLSGRSIVDLAPTVLGFCGVDAEGLDGAPIEEIVGARVAHARTGPGTAVQVGRSVGLTPPSDRENAEMLERLREMGYVE